jgi:O-antigen/teichoic acid export membrane protein
VTPQAGANFQPPRTLRNRTLLAGSWTLLGYGSDLFFKLISNLILTRLLFPEAFGAVAAASALIAGLNLVSDFGVSTIIIQSSRGDLDGFLRTAWTFLFWRSLMLWAIILILCGALALPVVRNFLPINSIYAEPSFALVFASMGFCLVLGSAESTCTFLNIRRLNYKPAITIQLLSRILTLPLMIAWAWIAPSVWALVGGSVAGAIFRLILSHTIVPGPWMKLQWNKDHLRELVRTGKWFTISSFGTFLSQQSDVILLGFLVPSSTLGLYSVAKLLIGVGEGLLDRLNYSLTLPVFSEVLRENPDNLRSGYYYFRWPIDIAAGVFGGGLFTAGHFIVNFLYDARYTDAGTMLPILALGTAIYPYLIIRSAFAASSETHLYAAISIVQALSLIVLFLIGFGVFGLLGAVWAVALHRIIPSLMAISLARQRNWIVIWREFTVIPAFLAGALLGKGAIVFASALGLTNIHQLLQYKPF